MDRNATERPLVVFELLALHGNLATIKSQSVLPPGSRVYFELTGKPPQSEQLLCTGKIVQLKKADAGSFEITIRLHSTSKALQKELTKLAEA